MSCPTPIYPSSHLSGVLFIAIIGIAGIFSYFRSSTVWSWNRYPSSHLHLTPDRHSHAINSSPDASPNASPGASPGASAVRSSRKFETTPFPSSPSPSSSSMIGRIGSILWLTLGVLIWGWLPVLRWFGLVSGKQGGRWPCMMTIQRIDQSAQVL